MLISLKKLYQEPLIHFLTLGVLMYALVAVFSGAPAGNHFAIEVNEPVMVRFLQFQNKAFNAQLALKTWQGMSDLNKQTLIDDYVREEVMYREALNMKLHSDDQIIRRRLIQKIEFINAGFNSQLPTIDERALQNYFRENSEQYIIDGSMTFSHVFFDKKSGQAQGLAQQALLQLNKQKIPFEQAAQFGQRFFFHRNYVDRTENFVASHFGADFSRQVFAFTKSDLWHGPIESKYGSHLVKVKNNHPQRMPALKEVAPQVLQDLQRVKQDEQKNTSLKRMISKYQVNSLLDLKLTIKDSNTGEHYASIH